MGPQEATYRQFNSIQSGNTNILHGTLKHPVHWSKTYGSYIANAVPPKEV